jgi:SAM-dependent methyltransferase
MKSNDYNGIANLYDIYVPADFDIQFFLEETRRIKGPVLELMAGTGRVSIPLIEAGIDLTCVDNSQEMLELLREKLQSRGLQSNLVCEDVLSLNLDQQFAGVIIPFNSFAHLVTLAEQKKALAWIRRHLLPDGFFICTLGNPLIRQKQIDGNLRLYRKYNVPETGGSLLLWILEKFSAVDNSVVETDEFFEEYDCDGVLTRKRHLEINFRLSDRMEFESAASETGFTVVDLYGDFDRTAFNPRTSPHMIWILKPDAR